MPSVIDPAVDAYRDIPTLASLGQVQHAGELVDQQLPDPRFPHPCLADPVDIQGGLRIALDLIVRNVGELDAPYALYSPEQAASVLRMVAECAKALGRIAPLVRRAAERMAERGDIDHGALPDVDADEVPLSYVTQAGAALRALVEQYSRVPYRGFTDPGEDGYRHALLGELRRRNIKIIKSEVGYEISYIDFELAGLRCEIRDEEGWRVRLLLDSEHGPKVRELDGLGTHYGSATHPRAVIDEAVAAVDRYVGAQVPGPR